MKKRNRSLSLIFSMVLALILWGVMALVFDFYYDMNDDILIKDILSGTYTGTPDGHNMQMQFILGWLISLMYRVLPQVPWMGLIEIILMGICFALLVDRTLEILLLRINNRYRIITGILSLLALIVFAIAGAGYEIVIIQYTFVSGLLALTAALLVATETSDCFRIKNNIVPLVLAILSFNVRSEMFLLMCPFLAVAGMYRWMREGISKTNTRQYLGFVGIIIVAMALSSGVESAAYSSGEWKEFREIFDARTLVYDFTGIAPYEGNEDFYASINVTEQEVDCLEKYDFTSFPVTAQELNSIAQYSSSDQAITTKTHKSLKYAVREYAVSVFKILLPGEWSGAADDSAFYEDGRISAPYNLIIIILYLILIVAIIVARDKVMAITTVMLLAMRSISWIYVIYKDRVNARIAHPMYICEIVLIMAILMASSDYLRIVALASLVMAAGLYVPATLSNINAKIIIRESNNQVAKAVYEYAGEHSQEYYFLDVYTMTGCSEKIFDSDGYQKKNTQLAGGWIALSPLDDYKQSLYSQSAYRLITRDELEGREAVDLIEVNGSSQTLKVYRENE